MLAGSLNLDNVVEPKVEFLELTVLFLVDMEGKLGRSCIVLMKRMTDSSSKNFGRSSGLARNWHLVGKGFR